jgi:hypothetical protein
MRALAADVQANLTCFKLKQIIKAQLLLAQAQDACRELNTLVPAHIETLTKLIGIGDKAAAIIDQSPSPKKTKAKTRQELLEELSARKGKAIAQAWQESFQYTNVMYELSAVLSDPLTKTFDRFTTGMPFNLDPSRDLPTDTAKLMIEMLDSVKRGNAMDSLALAVFEIIIAKNEASPDAQGEE